MAMLIPVVTITATNKPVTVPHFDSLASALTLNGQNNIRVLMLYRI